MNDQTDKMKRVIRKLKIKRVLVTICLIIICVPLILALLYKTTQTLAGKQSWKLMEAFEVRSEILAPNIQNSDNYLSSTSFWGGTVTSHRYKEIDGYRVPWSTLSGTYNWNNYQEDALNSSGTDTDSTTKQIFGQAQVYDRKTQQKIPVFFNVKHHYQSTKGFYQIRQIGQVKNSVAEVAITFNHPLTYQQIKKMVPQNIETNWYWIGPSNQGDATDFSNNYLGLQAHDEQLTNSDFQQLRQDINHHANSISNFEIQHFSMLKYAKWYAKKHKTLKQAKFSGIIISGQTKNLAELKTASWIKYSSIGTVVSLKPYQKPNK
ncbi:MAG: anti sigma factor C-terminal domain-containing protein [Liquorilactobacillus nagelii]|uniref:anti sigma factor C-terminal domain-containing protein n=1 Tax=Liquorilactobacillus nagelii TaxID=82688 RepID=UPI0039EA82FD